MVCIAKEPEGDPKERLKLDDYNSDDFDEYFSDNMETTPPTITEARVATKDNRPAPPPPLAVTVTVQLDEQHPAEDLYERRRQLNQKRAFRRQRLANTLQEQQGDCWRFLKRQFTYRKRTDRVAFLLEYSPKVYQSTEQVYYYA